MAERRSLSTAIQSVPNADPVAVRAFVMQETKPAPISSEGAKPHTVVSASFQPVGLIPITVRLRPEIAGALKRASLERQLAAADFFSQQEIVERALPYYIGGNVNWNETNAKPIERAQELLNKYGNLMVKKGLLAE